MIKFRKAYWIKAMKTFEIVTLTVNPSLDKSTHFSGLVAEQKMRCELPHYDAGGGGINVSKAIARLGAASLAIYTAGGAIGKMLEELVAKEKIASIIIGVKALTRENFIAFDNNTQSQYRFGFPGIAITPEEQQQIMQITIASKPRYLVLSGSLNEGMPADFYKNIIKEVKLQGTRVIVDTSGEPLQRALEAGVFLVKPNIGELAKLVGADRLERNQIVPAAQQLIAKGNAEMVVVSLGAQGAVLVTKDYEEWMAAPDVTKKSTVGAGDSMVGAMVWALSQNKTPKEVLAWGVACGSAATMNEGTQLFKLQDAEKILENGL